MKVFYSDHMPLPLPPGHRFPAQKYRLLRQRVFESGLFTRQDLQIPAPATDAQLLQVHSASYVARATRGGLSAKEMRRIGFPWSQDLVQRARYSVGGTIAASRAALQDGVALNLAGGTHHAHADFGSGFCMFNDVAVAARSMQAEGRAQHLLILDCDVHQGDGTAAIFANDPTVFTFSIHGEKNFPFRKQRGDLDLALPDGCGDECYIKTLALGLDQALDQIEPDLVIYLAGADPFKDDHFGRMALTKAGLAERDRRVLDRCQAQRLPMAIVLSGGYARKVQDTVDIHFQTVHLAARQVHAGAGQDK